MLRYFRKSTNFSDPLPRSYRLSSPFRYELYTFSHSGLSRIRNLIRFWSHSVPQNGNRESRAHLNPLPLLRSSRGFSIITLIILVAFVFALFNAYAYFNPKFQLSRYSIVYFLHAARDKQRAADLAKIQAAVEKSFEEKGEYPASDGWCGPITSLLHSEVYDAIAPYFDANGVPRDPGFTESNRSYFYRRENRRSYILMAVFENLPAGSPTYSYSGCHDWPGDDVYNYKIEVSH